MSNTPIMHDEFMGLVDAMEKLAGVIEQMSNIQAAIIFDGKKNDADIRDLTQRVIAVEVRG